MTANIYKYIDEGGKHLHTHDGQALIGTSTVGKETLAKPLTWWASGLACQKLGWTNAKLATQEEREEKVVSYLEKIKQMQPGAYLELLDDAYRAHADTLNDAASDGTDLHALLEEYVNECLYKDGVPHVYEPIFYDMGSKVKSFSEWAVQNVERFTFSEAHCFSTRLWLGGIVDCMAIMKDGKKAVIDFKSAKDAYFDHYMQIALYDIQVSENGVLDADGNKIGDPVKADVYYVIPFGAPQFIAKPLYDIDGARKAAEALVEVYKYKQKIV